jgi:hypothetical protein
VPYAALWTIAGAGTFDDLVRLWAERDGPALLRALQRRTWKSQQSPYGRPWHGTRRVEKATVRDAELAEALTELHHRVRNNPVFWTDPRAIRLGAGDAILNLLSEIHVWNETRP